MPERGATPRGNGRMRPFDDVIRIWKCMMGQAVISMEVLVGLEAEVARLRRGDLDALAELVTRYQHRLHRYLLRMVRQPAEAEDLFQQTWLRVATQIRRFDPQRNFEAWLFTLARNLAIDHLRRVRPESLDEREERDYSTPASLRVSDPPALDVVIARERTQQLAEAMDALPVMYREVLALRFEEEMKLEEIAEVLNAPISTVKSRLRRGLEHLRQVLEARFPKTEWQ
ncbi:MAG TPA: sigma-70 family RNA polymerase sigma factor [Candidatus Dormibacteraeota bacterium]|nr:sigma-70 family RNA polymerase sigma factor [Candidatus Dormibacteraeota bacterium]